MEEGPKAQPLKRILRTIVVTIGIGFTAIPRSDADPPTCVRFNDSGCFFGEDFENGTLDGWAVSAGAVVTNVSPGLNGTNHKVQLSGSGLDQYLELDYSTFSYLAPDGSKFWFEFWIEFYPGFTFHTSPSGGQATNKLFDLRAEVGACAQNRILLTGQKHIGDRDFSYSMPYWSIYANNCGGGSGDSEWFANIEPGFAFRGGHVYHFIVELTSAVGTGGGFRCWQSTDGGPLQLIAAFPGIQTCGESPG